MSNFLPVTWPPNFQQRSSYISHFLRLSELVIPRLFDISCLGVLDAHHRIEVWAFEIVPDLTRTWYFNQNLALHLALVVPWGNIGLVKLIGIKTNNGCN